MTSRLRTIALRAAACLAAAACTPGDSVPAERAARRAESPDQFPPSVTPNTVEPTASQAAPDSSEVRSRRGASGSALTVVAPARATARPARRVTVGGLDLTGVGYDVGARAAPVVVVDFSDFGCPYCGQFARETYPVLEREYVRTGKVFYKHVPFVAGFPNGQHAARAAECAADQGKFWPMHDSLYAHQEEWRKTREPADLFERDAAAVGVDRARFDACYASQAVHPRTRRASETANTVGVRVTPSFIVNGRPVEGALPAAEFRRVIDAALLVEKARP